MADSASTSQPRKLIITQPNDNAGGWGPVSVPVQHSDIPFAPYNKGDKLGKAADWTASNYHRPYGQHSMCATIACLLPPLHQQV
jgi:hypothetical protein